MALSKCIEAEKADSFYSVSDPCPTHAPRFRRRHWRLFPTLWSVWPGLLSPAEALVCLPPRPASSFSPHTAPSRCLIHIAKVTCSHTRKGCCLCMRLDCSTAQEPLTGRLGPLRHHLVGRTHPACHVRLGAALLRPSAVLPSHSESMPVSTCPPGLYPLPSHPVSSHLPRLQQLQPQCPPCAVRTSRVFTHMLPSWNSQPGTLSRILRSLLPTSFTVSAPAGLPARRPEASAPVFHSCILVNNFFKGFIII